MIQICYRCSEHDDHYRPTNSKQAVGNIFKERNKITFFSSFIKKWNAMTYIVSICEWASIQQKLKWEKLLKFFFFFTVEYVWTAEQRHGCGATEMLLCESCVDSWKRCFWYFNCTHEVCLEKFWFTFKPIFRCSLIRHKIRNCF